MINLIEFKNVGIVFSLITLLAGITIFLFNIGVKDIMSVYPVFRERANKFIGKSIIFGIFLFLVALSYRPSIILLIIFLISVAIYIATIRCYSNKIELLLSESIYKTSRRKCYYKLAFVLTIFFAVAFLLLGELIIGKLDIFASTFLLAIFFLLILSSGYLYAITIIDDLKKVCITYKDENQDNVALECHWIFQIEDWIVVKLESGNINYLKKERIIKMELGL